MRPRAWHWIKPVATTRVPARHIVLDTEARRTPRRAGERQSWALGCACAFSWRAGAEAEEWADFSTPTEAWGWVDSHCWRDRRTVCWCHNLAYDLRISDAIRQLSALRWTLDGISIERGSAWARWRRGRQTLAMADTLSWVGMPLGWVGRQLGVAKPPLPAGSGQDGLLAARCRADVAITVALVRWMLALVEDGDLGSFGLTGAAQAWSCYRHRFMRPKSLLVHADPDALSAERRAMWCGRAECWRHGGVGGPVVEWDLTSAYASLTRGRTVPAGLVGEVPPPDAARWATLRRSRHLLADVTVTTSVPVVPGRGHAGVLWGDGTFASTLWDVEVEAARQAGATIEVHRCWAYHPRQALTAWDDWVLKAAEQARADGDLLAEQLYKQWARVLVGRMAARHRNWEITGTAIIDGPRLGLAGSAASSEVTEVLWIAGQMRTGMPRTESPESMPALCGWVMAATRVELWRAMRLLPDGSLIYCDTDGLLVDAAGDQALAHAAKAGLLSHWRRKHTHGWAEVSGPRQIVTPDGHHISGIPRKATRRGKDTWEGEVWEQLRTTLQRGGANTVDVEGRTFTLAGVDHRRTHLVGGGTATITHDTNGPAGHTPPG